MPFPKDLIKAEAARKKMSEAAKRRMEDPEIRNKIREANIGKKQSPETIAKRVEKLKGQKRPPRSAEWRRKNSEDPEYRKKMSDANKGIKQSQETIEKRVAKIKGQQRIPRKNCIICGKEFCRRGKKNETAKFCSTACKGKWQSENAVGEKGAHWQGGGITKKCQECGKEFIIEKNRKETARFCSQHCKGIWLAKMGLITKPPIMTGANHPQWTGGSKDYCEKWNLEFRRRIRAFFDHKCAECGTPQNEKLLHCHHVYYDKKACCSINEERKYFSNLGIKDSRHFFEIVGDPNKFVALCDNCHKKTYAKKNREYWSRHFEEIINNYYLGRSYFTKEEYEKIR
jgi:endogenous inhibitor of DNA gyrase (YacG/DUF329 family)